MALSNPRRVKLFIIWISLETYRPIGVKEVSISLPQYVHWFLKTTHITIRYQKQQQQRSNKDIIDLVDRSLDIILYFI